MRRYVVNLGILPKISDEKQVQIVLNFFELLKDYYDEVCYFIPKEDTLKRIGGEYLLEKLENMGIKRVETSEKNYLFKEEGEDALEFMFGDDPRFIEFAKLRLDYLIITLKIKFENEEDEFKKIQIKKDLEKYENIRKRFMNEKREELEEDKPLSITEKTPKTEENYKPLFIHLDFANFFPRFQWRKYKWHDFKLWAEFINSLISIVRKKLNHKGEYKVIAYLESYFKPRTKEEKTLLDKFINDVLDEEILNTEMKKEIITSNFIFLLKILGLEIEISPKEAEQTIPDKILELKEKYPQSLHAILSDDKARDTTECDLRVVHMNWHKRRVLGKGKAKEVISLEELTSHPYIRWFFEGNIEEQKEPIKVEYTEENFRFEIEEFSLYSYKQKTLVISRMIKFHNDNPEKFKEFWMNLNYDTKDNFLKELKEYKNDILKSKILLILYELDEDKREDILELLKNSIPYDIYEVLLLNYDEEKHQAELNWLRKKYENKIELERKIKNLEDEIKKIQKIAKDENITEERKRQLEDEFKRTTRKYEELKREITDYQNKNLQLTNEINKLQEQKKNLINKQVELNSTIQSLNQELQKINKDVEKLKSDKEKVEIELNKKKIEKQKLEEEVKKLTSQRNELNSQIEVLNSQKERLEENIKNLQEKKEELEKELEAKREEKEELEKIVKEREDELKEYEKIKETYDKLIKKQEMEEYINQHKEELKNLDKTLKELEKQKIKLTHDKQELESKKRNLEIEINSLEFQKQNLENEIKELERKKEEINKYRKELKNRKETLEQYKKLYPERASEIEKLIKEIDSFLKQL